ncbi:D-glycero-beta-D-manno-heptose 1-phosphate adenylyltransferase [Variovorax sp. J31P179]|uniref:D-glycero-beta-D-manno-heptose 1-phosphate adenylyltransferase n=1 Tax=Variovorax sp. J31P179 TaxID=3053508 RepID=UPI0025753236|nr:D-glycero-beta-D-manno-heptose 1-phosphate adenylyltransferase [Variovorax sp. J31P179]MDM0081959.1 D-glycero-beta-D-manno-heptose 1-phosphate adenylyltransferase [Variovorax sp. J31P179]
MQQPSSSPAKPRILVVGDMMLDRYVIGEVSRISPEAPVPVLAARHDENRPGGAANVAANIASMGGQATLLAVVGPDAASIELEKCLHDYGVQTLFLKHPLAGTTQKTRLVVGSQQIARVDRDVRPTPEMQAKLLSEFLRIAPTYDLIVFSDYAKGSLDRLPEFLAAAAERKIPTLVDPKRTDSSFYRGAYLLKPNHNEFVGLFGAYTSDDELVAQARAALAALQLRHLVVTRGAKGMAVVSADGRAHFVATKARDVFDVSGAGDTVLAALAVDLADGRSISDAVHAANVAAGVAVSHAGTYVVSKREIDAEHLKAWGSDSKVLTPQQLHSVLVDLRLKGQRIVFTNGCFDLLHPGHVRLLKAARALGDTLILGLNSDASIRALKGPERPVNPFLHRAEVLAGLAAVDYVVEFDAPTPLELIKAILPDTLVKGGDYPVAEIVGYEVVTERGGSVVALDFHDGYSTTKMIEKIGRPGLT